MKITIIPDLDVPMPCRPSAPAHIQRDPTLEEVEAALAAIEAREARDIARAKALRERAAEKLRERRAK